MQDEWDNSDVRDAGGWHVKGDRRKVFRAQGSGGGGIGLIAFNILFVEALKKDHGNLPI